MSPTQVLSATPFVIIAGLLLVALLLFQVAAIALAVAR